ncbi:MAG: glycosyltransferase family 4 protein [Deferrisomatales bacterium]
MKIALVHPKIHPFGGAEYYAYRLARGLIDRGHEVHLFVRQTRGVPEGAVVHRVPTAPAGRGLKALSFAVGAGRAVGRDAYDVVQGLGKTSFQTVHRTGGGVHRAYLEKIGARRRTLYDRVAIRIEDRLYASRRLQAVICASSLIGREVERFYPAAAPKVRIIPTGVDTGHFTPEGREADRARLTAELGIPAGAPLLLFVGTNFHRKGLDLAVEALAHLPGCHLVAAGGDARGPFEALARGLGVADRVHFVGFRTDRPALYRAADVFVFPTRYDPFANVCLEALACGTPVVTSDGDGAAEVVAETSAGEVTPLAAGGRGAAASVRAVLERGEGCREAARRCALGHSQDKHVEAVEALYEAVR